MQTDDRPEPLIAPLLAPHAEQGVRHGFFTRRGGVSEGIYRSLNLGIGSADELEKVLENRARVAAWFSLPPERLVTLHQVHSPDVTVIDSGWDGERRKVDAAVTATPGSIRGVLTADCGPILFSDAENGVIGAAHAGWRGALTGVLENTVEAMIRLGARREAISASLGPSIGPENYEVGPEFVERFVEADPAYERFFTPSEKPGHAMFDLPALTLARLAAAGVRAESLGVCTYPDEERFFSYRRTTHAREADYGRQISAIAITGE